MKIQNIESENFKRYGKVLSGYDFSELFSLLSKTEIPSDGIFYTGSSPKLEACREKEILEKRGFGAFPIQIGYVNSKNRVMNCLEYHKSCEFNIAMDDVILILGDARDVTDNGYDSEKAEAFLVPGGTGVELYSTTLHYAPIAVHDEGCRVICVLPRGTNGEYVEFERKTVEDKACFGVNKWLFAHPDSPEAKNGAFVFINGKNINFKDLEY